MVKTGALLIIIGAAALGFWLSPLFLTDQQPVLNILQPMLCAPGEKLTVAVVVTHDWEGTGYSGDYDCMRRNETTYDVTGKAFIIGGAAFTVPFLIGLFLLIVGFNRAVRGVLPAGAVSLKL